MTETTQHDMAEDINGRLADRRTNQMFGVPTARISDELGVKLGRLSSGLVDLADSLERDG